MLEQKSDMEEVEMMRHHLVHHVKVHGHHIVDHVKVHGHHLVVTPSPITWQTEQRSHHVVDRMENGVGGKQEHNSDKAKNIATNVSIINLSSG